MVVRVATKQHAIGNRRIQRFQYFNLIRRYLLFLQVY